MLKHDERHPLKAVSRREMLMQSGGGFGALALAGLLASDKPLRASETPSRGAIDPLAPKATHFPATAKSIIFLFMEGGPSHIDLFDPKPLLEKARRQTDAIDVQAGHLCRWANTIRRFCLDQRKWKQHGACGPMGERLVSAHRHVRR